jgi:DNA polymerase III epsilon subunit-like protein
MKPTTTNLLGPCRRTARQTFGIERLPLVQQAALEIQVLIRVIDIETTGIDPANDAITKIASVDKLSALEAMALKHRSVA